MPYLFQEENGVYQIDLSKSIWATDEIHSRFMKAIILSDVDFVCKPNDDSLIFIEYKNANVPEAAHPERFQPSDDKMLNKIAYKFYDTMIFLNHCGYTMPIKYIYILEYPNGDSVTRKSIRNKIAQRLPFELQKDPMINNLMIESFDVFSIDEWNLHYPQFPLNNITYGE